MMLRHPKTSFSKICLSNFYLKNKLEFEFEIWIVNVGCNEFEIWIIMGIVNEYEMWIVNEFEFELVL